MKSVIKCILLILLILPILAKSQDRTALNQYLKNYSELELNDTTKRVYSLIDISWEYLYINTDTALTFAELAVEIGESTTDRLALANAIGMLGTVKDVKGNLQGSLRDYLKALEICKALNDSNCIATMNNNIGATFYAQEDYAKSYPYFEKSYLIENAQNDTGGQIGSLINLAIIKKNLGFLDTSIIILNQALTLNSSFSNDYYLGTIYANLGAHHLALNQLNKSLEYFEKSIVYLEAQSQYQNYGLSIQNIASIHLKNGAINLALTYAQKAKVIAEEGEFFITQTDAYECLYETYLALNMMDSAFHFKNLYESFNDSIRLKENKEIVTELEAKYKTAEKETQLLTEKVKLVKEKKSSEFFKYLIGFALVLLFISLAFYIQKSKSNKALALQNKVIESSLAEKEVLMREIHHRVKNNIQAIKSIINIQKRKTSSEEVKQSLNITLNRVNAMSLIHSKLYQQTQITEIDSKQYLNELIKDVLSSFGLIDNKNLKIAIALTSHIFETDKLLTLGLIVNELVTNACKYGLSANKVLHLSIKSKITNNSYLLLIADKGEVSDQTEDISFGKELIAALVFKLEGTISYDLSSGYSSNIKIPIA
ncbi:MAG: histidine kinase dimerization/phosphoacceptor domain -containing protein [Crocinitomicaceae bacterium]